MTRTQMIRGVATGVLFFFAAGSLAYAAAPTLSLEATSGDSVRVTVKGDPNLRATLHYNIGSSWGSLSTTLGSTDDSGNISTILSSGAYGVDPESRMYVLMMNGDQSETKTWPYKGLAPATTTAVASNDIKFGTVGPTLNVGETLKVALSGGSGNGKYTIGNSPNPNLVQTTVTENALVLTALGAGSTFVTVCDITNTNRCSTIFLSILNAATAPAATPTSAPVSTPVSAVPAPAVPSVAAASTGDVLAEIRAMQTRLAQILMEIQTMNAKLQGLVSKITVTAPAVPVAVPSAAPSAAISGTAKYKFSAELKIGSRGDEVTALQNRLTLEGFYSGEVTGFYGSLTRQTVIRYQKEKGLAQTGIVDTNTRVALNGE